MASRHERVAILAPSGAVTVVDAPHGATPEIRIAGEQYAKAVFQPEPGVPGRRIYSAVLPLEQHMVERLR